jgi:hypothetical protein
VVSGRLRSRAWLFAFVVGLPTAGVAIACTAGDPIAYSAAAVSGAGADGGGDARVPPADGSLLTVPGTNDGGLVPALTHLPCSGLDTDGGCDPTAGMGCCLAGSSDTSGNNNTCLEQVQHYNSTGCKDPKDVFLGCLSSDTDNTCCWQPEGVDRHDTRFRTDCDGGTEACDPSADGGSCSTGGDCHMITCKGVVVGYCGGGPAPCGT